MNLEKYPAPNTSIESSMWLIMMEAVKIDIWQEIKSQQIRQIGLEDDSFFSEPYTSSEKIILLVLNIPEEFNLDDIDHFIDENNYDDLFLFSECISEYAKKVCIEKLSIDEAAYMCARDIFFTVETVLNER